MSNKKILFYIIMAVLYLFAWRIQQNLLLNSDVSWLMQASSRLLSGGTYLNDFFEINPPMILYLYIPAVLISILTHLTNACAMRLYIFLLASLSLLICTHEINKILTNPRESLASIFIITLAAIYLLLPMSDFGQREHLLIILTIPYFLSITTRLVNKYNKSTTIQLLIGVMAGAGFAMKPYFLISFILIETIYVYKKKSLINLVRIESMGVIAVLLIYICLLLAFHVDYLTFVLPYASQFYYQSVGSSLRSVIFSQTSFYVYFTIFLCFILYDRSYYKELTTILVVSLIGFFLSYAVQGTHWSYHAYPMLAVSTLLVTFLFSDLITREKIAKKEFVYISILSMFVFSYLFIFASYISQSIIFYPLTYFLFFSVLFSLLYIAHGKIKLPNIILSIFFILSVSYIYYKNIQFSIWQSHAFFLTTFMLLSFYAWLIPAKQSSVKLKLNGFSVIGMLFLFYPFYTSAYIYNVGIFYKKLYRGLVIELIYLPQGSMMFLTDSTEFAFPAIDYTHHSLASRFSGIIGLPDLRYTDDNNTYQRIYLSRKNSVDFLINKIANDMAIRQPHYILVDVRERNKTTKLGYFGSNQIDYVRLFTLNQSFNTEWHNYHYLKTIDGQPLYKFRIYERISRRG